MLRFTREYIQAVKQRDPAARSAFTIFLTYPGLHAQIYYRMAHCLWCWRLKGLALCLSYFGRMVTGIEIHPAARIGRRVFIDHGMGVVIGQTAIIGDDVTLYQGVTLGGISSQKSQRHPILGVGVIVGAGAQILGPIKIGDYARIGSNAVVLKDVDRETTVVGVPARPVAKADLSKNPCHFLAYATSREEILDPICESLQSLTTELADQANHIRLLQEEIRHLHEEIHQAKNRGRNKKKAAS